MIGYLYTSITKFYDIKTHKMAFKARPVLIIAGPRNNDYTVLPVSSVSNSKNLDTEYDIKIDPNIYTNLNLAKVSYIRTHKVFVVHEKELLKPISNLRDLEPDLYLDIMMKYEQWSKHVVVSAFL